jgi:hypothetical protein
MAHEELPPLNITPGAIRFNTDSMKLEYFRIGMEGGSTSSYAGIGTLAAGEWVQITTDTPDVQTGGTRGVTAGGVPAPNFTAQTTMDYVNIATTGDAITFGNLAESSWIGGGVSSRTRGIVAGGRTKDPIQVFTIASTGDATDSGGNLVATNQREGFATASDSTRGLFAGGGANPFSGGVINAISYVTMASLGDTVDFGDLTVARRETSGVSNSTRGVFLGAFFSPNSGNTIDFVTISTLGNAADFGDLLEASNLARAGLSNSVRGLVKQRTGGTIDYITIATLGNAVEFGTTGTFRVSSATSSPTRGIFSGGYSSPSPQAPGDTIDYVQIMSLGDAVDFGDLTQSRAYCVSVSNGHGGLG